MVDLIIGKNKAFTLIELLVVIAIIGVLASVTLATLNSTREMARDTQIYSDLNQMQIALEMYYNDNGSYPVTTGWWTVCTTGADTTARGITGSTGYVPNLAPEYIPELPTNPAGCIGGVYDGYMYNSNGKNYKFSTDWSAEIGSQCQLGMKFADPPRTTINNHTFCSIYTPGAAEW